VLRLSQPPGGARTALLACFADEQHVLPLLVVAFHLAQWGYRTTMLGARTPPQEIRQAVARLRPDVVCLSTIYPSDRERMEELVREYADACGGVAWVVGGGGTEGLEQLIGDLGGIVAPPDLLSLQPRLSRALAGRRKS